MHENSASAPIAQGPCPLGQDNGDQSTTGPSPHGDPKLFNDVISEAGARPIRFFFGYGELPVSGEIRLREDGAELRLFVVVGRLPYTAESHSERRAMLGLIRAVTAELGDTIVVSPDQLICLSGTAVLDIPLTPAALIAAQVTILQGLDPLLEGLAPVLPDLGPAMTASGRNETEAETPAT